MRSIDPSPQARTPLWLRLRTATLAVVVAGSACAAFSVHAQGSRGHEGRPGMMLFGGPPEHVARGVDRWLDGLGANEAQRTQIKQIAQAAATDLKAQRESMRGLHEKSLQLFAAPNVDATGAEALRQQMSAQHDQASKRVLAAMLDVSKVLTPEQRVKMGERMRNREAQMHDRLQRMQRDPTPAPRS